MPSATGPYDASRRERRRASAAELAIAAEGDRPRDVTADAARMPSAAAWARAGSRPVMPTPAPSTASPMAVILPCRLDLQ